ncbi:MAG: putative N-acetylmuramoyl-L-alanine amidase [Paenibacillus sp.]|nr:putative N-acetylmuramoyl-L-alanine amidase [Paenibacillus sp.]
MSIVDEIIAAGGYPIVPAYLTPDQWVRPEIKITPTKGIIHWTGNMNAGANSRANRNYFENLTGGYASAHTVGDDDSILACIPYLPNEAEMAYHVGANTYSGQFQNSYPNAYSLGHEMCVNKDGNFRESYKRSVWVLAYWSYLYGWDVNNDVARHYDVTRKHCPLPFIDLIFDDRFCTSIGFSHEDISWMRQNLHIDGIQGETLWIKFTQDVSQLTQILREENGSLQGGAKKVKFTNDYQWGMLVNALHQLYVKSTNGKLEHPLLTDYGWVNSAYSGDMTIDDMAWLAIILLCKDKGILV